MALTPVVMKSFEKLVLAYLKDITGPWLDPLLFAYRANRSVDDAVNMGLHFILQHLDKTGIYVRILFVDFSSAFNTIIPTLLHTKLTRAERLIDDIAIWKNAQFQPQRLRLHSVTWHARVGVKRCVRLEDRSIDRMTLKYGERKHKETSALLYLSQYFDDTHNDRSSSAASSRTHLSSLQSKHQVGTLCCQVRSLPQVVFVSAGLA